MILSALLDSMSNGIKTLEAADNALTSITSSVQSMQSTLRQARQDRSFKTNFLRPQPAHAPVTGTEQMSFSGGSVGATAVNVALTTGAAYRSDLHCRHFCGDGLHRSGPDGGPGDAHLWCWWLAGRGSHL